MTTDQTIGKKAAGSLLASDFWQKLAQSYGLRRKEEALAAAAVEETMTGFPAILFSGDGLPQRERPGLQLALAAGDLGLALFWNSQAAMVHPLVSFFAAQNTDPETTALVAAVSPRKAGAFAFMEKRSDPFSARPEQDGLRLSGTKTYVMGGSRAEFLFLTLRDEGEPFPERVVFVPKGALPASAFSRREGVGFRTTLQSKLSLQNQLVSGAKILAADGRRLRRQIRIGGILEASLGRESLLGFLLYLMKRCEQAGMGVFPQKAPLEKGLQNLSASVDGQIRSWMEGSRLLPVPGYTDLITDSIAALTGPVGSGSGGIDGDLKRRLEDLAVMQALLPEI